MESSNNIACLKAAKGKFLIYNTLTGDSFVVDDVPLRQHSSLWLGYGFGYDPCDDDYKILVVFPTKYLHLLKPKESGVNNTKKDGAKRKYSLLYVYSLRKRNWKSFETDSPCVAYDWYPFTLRCRSYSFNGVLHWAVWNKMKPCRVVGTLDLHSLMLSEFGLPTAVWDPRPSITLSELDGQLCCCVYSATFDVWVMKEYGVQDSWTKLLTIDRFRIMYEYPPVHENYDPCVYGRGMKSCVVHRCGKDGNFVVFFCHGFKVKLFEFDVNKDTMQVLFESNWREWRTLRWWKRWFKECFC